MTFDYHNPMGVIVLGLSYCSNVIGKSIVDMVMERLVAGYCFGEQRLRASDLVCSCSSSITSFMTMLWAGYFTRKTGLHFHYVLLAPHVTL